MTTRIQIDIPSLSPTQTEILRGSLEGFLATYGTGDHDDALGALVKQATTSTEPLATDEQVKAARDEYETGDTQIDDDAQVIYTEDPDAVGADFCWIQAWVRVEDAPMPVTANRVMHYLRSEVEYPATLTLEDATAHALAQVHANHSPDALLSPSDLRDELLDEHLWDSE